MQAVVGSSFVSPHNGVGWLSPIIPVAEYEIAVEAGAGMFRCQRKGWDMCRCLDTWPVGWDVSLLGWDMTR